MGIRAEFAFVDRRAMPRRHIRRLYYGFSGELPRTSMDLDFGLVGPARRPADHGPAGPPRRNIGPASPPVVPVKTWMPVVARGVEAALGTSGLMTVIAGRSTERPPPGMARAYPSFCDTPSEPYLAGASLLL